MRAPNPSLHEYQVGEGNGVELDRLPLANQLFENRKPFVEWLDKFPDCKSVLHRLRKPNVSVEQELAKLQSEAVTVPERLRQLAAIQYYLHCCLWQCEVDWSGRHSGITNYVALLDEIERWRCEFNENVCFVTFNYDRMLEDALAARREIGFHTRDMDGYISGPYYAVIKLHGSVNWGQEVIKISDVSRLPRVPSNPFNTEITPRNMIDMCDRLQLSDSYKIVRSFPMVRENQNLVFPALAIPVKDKDRFVCPQNHIDWLTERLPGTTKIITIGWRATEASFLDILRSELHRSVDLMVVSDDVGAGETVGNLTTTLAVTTQRTITVSSGFSGLVFQELGKLEGFLRDTSLAANA